MKLLRAVSLIFRSELISAFVRKFLVKCENSRLAIFIMRQHAELDIVLAVLSVSPSVRPSVKCDIVSKLTHLSSKTFRCLVWA